MEAEIDSGATEGRRRLVQMAGGLEEFKERRRECGSAGRLKRMYMREGTLKLKEGKE